MHIPNRKVRPLLAVPAAALLMVAAVGCGDDEEVQVSGNDPTDQSTTAPGDTAEPGSSGDSGDPDTPVSSPSTDDSADGSDPTDLPDMTPIPIADAQVLVGMTLRQAEAEASERNWSVRVVRLDGEDLAATDDFSPTRVNVATEDDVVTEVLSIG